MKRSGLQKIEGQIRVTRESSYGGGNPVRIVDATLRWEHPSYLDAPRQTLSGSGVLVDLTYQFSPEKWYRTVLQPSQIVDETPEAYRDRKKAEKVAADREREEERRTREEDADRLNEASRRIEHLLGRQPLITSSGKSWKRWAMRPRDIEALVALAEKAAGVPD